MLKSKTPHLSSTRRLQSWSSVPSLQHKYPFNHCAGQNIYGALFIHFTVRKTQFCDDNYPLTLQWGQMSVLNPRNYLHFSVMNILHSN